MNLPLAVAGLLCLLLAVGHTLIGVRWVLPHATEEHFPPTPFGPSSMSARMIRVSWYIVTIFVVTLGGLLITLAFDTAGDARTLLLRWFSVMWVAAAVMALWVARHGLRNNPRAVVRLPVPFVWLVIALLCWQAST